MRILGSSEPVILDDWMISGKLANLLPTQFTLRHFASSLRTLRFVQIVRRKGRKELAKLRKGVLFIIKLHKVPKFFLEP